MSDFIFAYYIKWSSDFKFSIFLSRSSIFANRRSVSAEIDALDEISTSKTDINFANPDLKFEKKTYILLNFNTFRVMTVIYLTDSHVCLASSTAFEKIELFFRQQGWIQTDGWIERFLRNSNQDMTNLVFEIDWWFQTDWSYWIQWVGQVFSCFSFKLQSSWWSSNTFALDGFALENTWMIRKRTET